MRTFVGYFCTSKRALADFAIDASALYTTTETKERLPG